MNATQNIHLDGELKTEKANQRGLNRPQRLSKREKKIYWRGKFTQLHIEEQERKLSQTI